MEILNVHDVQNVNLILESLSQIHYDKLKYGKVKADYLNLEQPESDSFFTEEQKAFLSIFMGSLKAKSDEEAYKRGTEVAKTSLFETP